MKVAVIASAGGSPFFEVAAACPHVEFDCITDRDCPAERGALARGFRHVRIEEPSNAAFSRKAAEVFARFGPYDAVVTLFGRLLTAPLVGAAPVMNVHPSLLPAFPGLGAVRAAKAAGAEEFGATLHGLVEGIDEGPIIAQVRGPLDAGSSLARLQKISFVHKTYVFFVGVEMLEKGALRFADGVAHVRPGLPERSTAAPCLTSPRYVAHVAAICEREGVVFP